MILGISQHHKKHSDFRFLDIHSVFTRYAKSLVCLSSFQCVYSLY